MTTEPKNLLPPDDEDKMQAHLSSRMESWSRMKKGQLLEAIERVWVGSYRANHVHEAIIRDLRREKKEAVTSMDVATAEADTLNERVEQMREYHDIQSRLIHEATAQRDMLRDILEETLRGRK